MWQEQVCRNLLLLLFGLIAENTIVQVLQSRYQFVVRDEDSGPSPEIWYRVRPPGNPDLAGQGTGLAQQGLGFVSLGELNK